MANKFTYVVLGPGHTNAAGMIKQIVLLENVASPLVEFKDGIARISTAEEKAKTGTEFLEKLYDAEGKPDHFKAFEAHRDAIREGRPVKPFPDSLLPAKVLEWRAGRGNSDKLFDPEKFVADMAPPRVEKATKADKATKAEIP